LSSPLTPTITVTPDLFISNSSFLQWLMSVELHRPPKPEESQKNSKFSTEKPYLTRDSNPEPPG
jgi:hypothetical protein